MQTVAGWLFGLKSQPDAYISFANGTLRQMTDLEQKRILHSSRDFFARDPQIWMNCIKSFPLVFEKKASDKFAVGSIDNVAVLLSLLAPGEIRTPIVWSTNESGGGSEASSSEVIEMFYRFINGRFQTIDLEVIRESTEVMFTKLGVFLNSDNRVMDQVIMDRLFESKRHPLTAETVDSEIIARAADICIALESLYGEGQGELKFRLAISIACLLESEPHKRESVMKVMSQAYDLRSTILHGGRPSRDTKKKIESVMCADRLLRRSILTRLLNNLDDKTWLAAFKQARLGAPNKFDTAEWVKV